MDKNSFGNFEDWKHEEGDKSNARSDFLYYKTVLVATIPFYKVARSWEAITPEIQPEVDAYVQEVVRQKAEKDRQRSEESHSKKLEAEKEEAIKIKDALRVFNKV